MRTPPILPYLASPAGVRAERWCRSDRAGEPLPDSLPEWDPALRLQIARRLILDIEKIRADCRLSPRDSVSVGATWHSPGTNLRGSGGLSEITVETGEPVVDVALDLPGEQLAGSVTLRTVVVALAPSQPGDPLCPTLPGSILWSDEERLVLEGRGSRFPMEVVSSSATLRSGFGWMLDWDPDSPDLMLLGSVRLLIEEGSRKILAAVTASNPLPEHSRIQEAIFYDVGRTMICGALSCDDFVAATREFEEGSVGLHVQTLLGLCFPGESMASLRTRMQEDPAGFEGEIRARLLRWREA